MLTLLHTWARISQNAELRNNGGEEVSLAKVLHYKDRKAMRGDSDLLITSLKRKKKGKAKRERNKEGRYLNIIYNLCLQVCHAWHIAGTKQMFIKKKKRF